MSLARRLAPAAFGAAHAGALSRHGAAQALARPLSAAGFSTGQSSGGGGGVFKEFVDKVTEEVEKNPELKQSMEDLKKQAGDLKDRTEAFRQQADSGFKSVSDSAEAIKAKSREAAEKFAESQQGLKDRLGQVGGSFGSQFSDAAEQLKAGFFANDSKDTKDKDGAAGSGAQGEHASQEKAGAGAGSDTKEPSRFQRIYTAMAKEVREVFSPPEDIQSATFRPKAADVPEGNDGPSELVMVKKEKTAFEKQYENVKEQVSKIPVFQKMYSEVEKVRETPMAKSVTEQAGKVRERVANMKEDLQERWETSDSAVVHGIQNVQDSMFAESERARAMRIIRQRDAGFDMVRFLLGVRADIPEVLTAYLTGDSTVLEKHCSKEMVERLSGQFNFLTQEGQIPDSTILDTGEIELVDVKILENEPLVVLRFSVQQINCSRDKFGNVIEGAPDDVQRVYYLWALQQDAQGIVDEDGKFWAPRWQLREMIVQGMHQLL